MTLNFHLKMERVRFSLNLTWYSNLLLEQSGTSTFTSVMMESCWLCSSFLLLDK